MNIRIIKIFVGPSAIEFAGAPRAVGVAAATLAQLRILLPIALTAVAVLVHGSGGALYGVLARRESKLTPAGNAGPA